MLQVQPPQPPAEWVAAKTSATDEAPLLIAAITSRSEIWKQWQTVATAGKGRGEGAMEGIMGLGIALLRRDLNFSAMMPGSRR